MASDICDIPTDDWRSYDVEFSRFLLDNVRQIEENKYDEMKREKQMIDTQKSLANVLSLLLSLFLAFHMCLFFSFSLLRGQTDTIDRPETRMVNKQSV